MPILPNDTGRPCSEYWTECSWTSHTTFILLNVAFPTSTFINRSTHKNCINNHNLKYLLISFFFFYHFDYQHHPRSVFVSSPEVQVTCGIYHCLVNNEEIKNNYFVFLLGHLTIFKTFLSVQNINVLLPVMMIIWQHKAYNLNWKVNCM